MEVIRVRADIDYYKIGQRIKTARQKRGLTQADLGERVGCSNNHLSHVEIGQTKVSLSMLLKISFELDYDLNFFLTGTPYASKNSLIHSDIANKLEQCNTSTLLAVSKIIDILLEQQDMLSK